MALQGRLGKKQFGTSMPVTAPAVQDPPFYYRKMELLVVDYTTDQEAALDILPEGLELAEPATAGIIFAKYHFSTFGPYNEAIMCIAARWQGKPVTYLPYLFVTQEAPLIAGREIWGYAKKLGFVDIVQQSEEYMGVIERPRGNRLATAVMRTISNVPPRPLLSGPVVSLKLIPHAEPEHGPALAELVACDFKAEPILGSDGLAEVWSGPGSLYFNAATETDPWYRLSVKQVLSCRYGFYNGFLPHGRILKSW